MQTSPSTPTPITYKAYQSVQSVQSVQSASLDALKADIEQGMADVQSGRVSALDMKTIKAKGRAAMQAKASA